MGNVTKITNSASPVLCDGDVTLPSSLSIHNGQCNRNYTQCRGVTLPALLSIDSHGPMDLLCRYIVSRGVGSPLPVGENLDPPRFSPLGLQKLSSPSSGGFRHLGPN